MLQSCWHACTGGTILFHESKKTAILFFNRKTLAQPSCRQLKTTYSRTLLSSLKRHLENRNHVRWRFFLRTDVSVLYSPVFTFYRFVIMFDTMSSGDVSLMETCWTFLLDFGHCTRASCCKSCEAGVFMLRSTAVVV